MLDAGASLADDREAAAIDRGCAHADPAIRDLFERFVPEEQRVKRLGSAIKPAAILALAGDADRGRELFLERPACSARTATSIGEARPSRSAPT